MITLTAAAAEGVRVAALQSDAEGMPLRLAAKLADDGSVVFGMGFDDQREQDLLIESEGIAVLVSPPSQDLLENATLDFAEVRSGEFGFVVIAAASGQDAPAEGGCGSGACKCRGNGPA